MEAWAGLLIGWYDKNKRDLPWRQAVTPYHIWISEIMAQQTRITQLMPYYKRFIARFPDVATMAHAETDEVLKAWEGLGYYSRARNMHKAARIIVNERGGQWPDTYESWQRLPGIGAYTAGAIMSIVYGAPVAAVDGNVLRVHARLANDETDIATPLAKAKAKDFIERAMPHTSDAVSRFTQALMELGALVCLPRNPLCGQCPLCDHCLAFRLSRQQTLPYKSQKKPVKHQDKTVLMLIGPQGAVLMRKRTEKLLGGMWVFYMLDQRLTEAEAAAYVSDMGFTLRHVAAAGEASHQFTHLTWHMTGYAVWINEAQTPHDYVFVPDIASVAMPTAIGHYRAFYLSIAEHTPNDPQGGDDAR